MAAKNSTTTGGLGGSVLRILEGVLIGAVLICGAFYGAAYFLSHAPSSVHLSDAQLYPLAHAERKAALATDEASPLELQSWNCDKERHYMYLRGEVKNVSTRRLEAVFAVGEFRTKDGELVNTDGAVLDYNPVMPGQTSSFTVMDSDNPMISNCVVRFKHVSGVELAARRE